MNSRLRHLAIDLTPLLPGAANGGAKPVALELVRALSAASPSLRITLLSLQRSEVELSAMASGTLALRVVDSPPQAGWTARLARGLMALRPQTHLLHRLGADLYFCPFTAPFFDARGVPCVSLFHDLQYRSYPEFFTAADRAERDTHAGDAARKAARLIAPSEFVKNELIEFLKAPAERIAVIPHGTHRRFGHPAPQAATALLDRLELRKGEYYLYPANAWQHKNHRMLLVALARRERQAPATNWRVVLTGAEDAASTEIVSAARAMGLGQRIVHAGYLADPDFAHLLASSRALLFPSLYEGFGMPVIEAMEAGVPVLCSNTTSLPEVTGGAAFLFDPRKPDDIAAAMDKLEREPGLPERLSLLGRTRAATIGGAAAMAQRYLAVFDQALGVQAPEHAA